MSLNELLRDNNSNKWANLNVQSVTAITENVTTVNATTVNSIQENTLREVIKAVDNVDHVLDMSKDLQTARIVSKVASSGALQPYEIQASNLLWRNANPVDQNEIILAGTQLNTAGSVGTVRAGRHKMIFANISGAAPLPAPAVIQSQSGGITAITHDAVGQYTLTLNGFTNIFYCVANCAQNNAYFCVVRPQSNTQVVIDVYDAGSVKRDAVFIVAIFGDAV